MACAVALALAACAEEGAAPAVTPMDGVVELSDQFTGDFALVDKTGAARTDEDFRGKVMLVYFGFTHCPDVCPGDIGVISAALDALGDAAAMVAPVFISVDPERDTPDALAEYFAFDERIVPLTGDVAAAKAAQRAFKQFAQKEPLPDSALEYTVNHGRFFYVADRQGQPIYALVGGAGPEEVAALLRRAIAETA